MELKIPLMIIICSAWAGLATASEGLSDLESMTFSCPQAGLNAAAREAAKVPSQGRYQFAYFRIASDSHHASYEIHFKSNYEEEADLKYCVSVYCQQGQDPDISASVGLIRNESKLTEASGMGASHKADCGDHQMRAKGSKSKRRLKR